MAPEDRLLERSVHVLGLGLGRAKSRVRGKIRRSGARAGQACLFISKSLAEAVRVMSSCSLNILCFNSIKRSSCFEVKYVKERVFVFPIQCHYKTQVPVDLEKR